MQLRRKQTRVKVTEISKRRRKINSLLRHICLLLVVGIMSFMVPLTVHATDADNNGDTDERTYEEEPGSSTSPNAPNIGNTVTILNVLHTSQQYPPLQ